MSDPFICSQIAFQVAENPSKLFAINLVTGDSSEIAPLDPANQYNAIGFNILDNYIYGANNTTRRIVRISSDATTEELPVVPNLPTDKSLVTADIDKNGYYYVQQNLTDRFYVVDLNPIRTTFMQLVDPANGFALQTSDFGVPLAFSSIFDWAFHPIDNQLYSIRRSSGRVVRINPITGAATSLTTSGLPGAGEQFGAVFFDSSGNFYGIHNETGDIYKITITDTTATGVFFSTATASSFNDGARCPLAQLDLLTVEKSVDKTQAVLGEVLTYTIFITNISPTTAATGIIFTDPYPNGTSYVEGSATVNEQPAVGTPATGITIGTLEAGETATVEYQVIIDNNRLPYPNPIPNTASVSYDQGLPILSNTVYTRVIFPERGIPFI